MMEKQSNLSRKTPEETQRWLLATILGQDFLLEVITYVSSACMSVKTEMYMAKRRAEQRRETCTNNDINY